MDPQQRFLRRLVLAVAIGFSLVAAGALMLGLAILAQPGDGVQAADPTTRAMALVLGWLLLAGGPVVGLRIGGLPWRRAAWALPAIPLLALVAEVLA